MPEVLTPDLPDDFGLMEVACSDGQHRFLPDALRCGCLKTINPEAERSRLERDVLRCAKLFTAIKDGEINATWTDRVALAANDLDDAVRNLNQFESSQQQIKK